ncbi:MAG TPA: sigma-70 family RNA polymerase sigma factor, partial [Ilumatobacteraceae bacterium]|nr:sigma-70 family RNA polymerase sigma factor [Ilumatobacteraceae bacterium]
GQLSEASTGLVTTAIRNRFIDGARAAAGEERRLRLVAVTDAEPVVDGPDVSDGAAGSAERDGHDAGGGEGDGNDVAAAMARLSDRDRAALVLRYVDELSVAQVAAELNLSVHAT